jgi:hypothetical protein
VRERLVFEIADREFDDGVLAMFGLDEANRFGAVGQFRMRRLRAAPASDETSTRMLALLRARSGPASARGIQLQGIVPDRSVIF